jgi:hypothetical protein
MTRWQRVVLIGVLALPAGAAPRKAPQLTLEHVHPSGAFSFKTPAGWTFKRVPDRPDVLEAGGDGLLVRFYFRPQEIGLDSLHVMCMDMRLLGAMETSPQVKYEHDFVGGALGERKVLDSAFEVRYDREVSGASEWRQRNVTIVGLGQSLCASSHAPRARWKKSAETRALLDAILASVRFR